MNGRHPGLSIRARLLLLVLAATLPLLLFSTVLLQRAYNGSAELVEGQALGQVRRLAVAVEAQVSRAQAIVAALAESPLMDEENLAAFEDTASRALQATGLDGVAMLARADGSKLAHTLSVPGGVLPPINDRIGLNRMFATGKPQVSGLYTGNITHEQQVALHVPVFRGGEVRFDGVIALSARSITATLLQQPLPPGWFAVVSDASGTTVARTRNAVAAVGEPISPGLAALIAGAREGFAPVSTREGEAVYAAFTHSELTGWTVTVAVPAAVTQAPRLRSIAALAGGGAVLLLASLGLAWLIGRHIARPVHALADEAARLGRSELPDPAATRGVAEAEAAGTALHEAGLLLAARDRDREAALRRAEESEARLLLAQEAGEIGAWETDAVTGRHTWSQQQFKLFGIDPASPVPSGPAWSALIHPDDRGRVAATVARSYGEPLAYQHDFRILLPGGGVRWVRSAGRSLFVDGKPQRLIGVTLDTTDRHEAEQVLRQGAARLEAEVAARTHELAASEARMRTYFENSAEALLVVNVTGQAFVFETLNNAATAQTGYSAEDVNGKALQDVLLPDTAAAMQAMCQEVLDTSAPLRLNRTLDFPVGVRELDLVLVPVRDKAGGHVTRIICGQRDLTEQRRLETQLAHAQRMEAVGQLTGGVAHDFNNLLTVVIGNLSMLSRRLPHEPRIAQYLASIEQAVNRGAKLTASLLAFSRRSALQVTAQDVGALLTESTTLLRRALGEEIELLLDVTPGLPPAKADAAQLEAAVLNLAINARDAIMDAMAGAPVRGGTLHISVRPVVLRADELAGNDEAKPGRFIAIRLQDTGTGMAPEVRARAFEPFFTTKEIGRGTGLGLSQVYGFVRQLGGHVTLDSTPGHGTAVTMFLPLAQAAAEPEAAVLAPRSIPPGTTVLVVEDDVGIRDVTAEVLQDAGLAVLAAADGPGALAILRGSTRVDALFSDVVMPGGATGVDLARAARALRPELPVLLTSGYAGTALTDYGADGEFDVLPKPYTRAVLLARISEVVAPPAPHPARDKEA